MEITYMNFQNSKKRSETSREISWSFAINFTKFQLKFQQKFHLKFPFYSPPPLPRIFQNALKQRHILVREKNTNTF